MPIVGRNTAAGGMPGAVVEAAAQKWQAIAYEELPYWFLAHSHLLVHGQHVQANHDNVRVMLHKS